MKDEWLRITDGYDRTIEIIPMKDGRFQTVMYEASTDYHQNAWFATEKEAIYFSEKWVFKK